MHRDEPAVAQLAQVVGDQALRPARRLTELADAPIAARQLAQPPPAHRVAGKPEKPRQSALAVSCRGDHTADNTSISFDAHLDEGVVDQREAVYAQSRWKRSMGAAGFELRPLACELGASRRAERKRRCRAILDVAGHRELRFPPRLRACCGRARRRSMSTSVASLEVARAVRAQPVAKR